MAGILEAAGVSGYGRTVQFRDETMDNLAVISSWSGGKDGCLACYKVMHQGYRVKYLLNFVSRESQRVSFHGIEKKLIQLQAESIGIPLVQKEVVAETGKYEKAFKSAVAELKTHGIKRMVFGDVYVDENRKWVERVCRDLEIVPIEPLWNLPPENIVTDFIDSGFKAIVVSAKADLFDKDFVGRSVDKDFLSALKERNICPCGENGEFHTFVVDGPIFRKKIEILESKPIIKEGFWKYWFLDIKKYQAKKK